MRTACWSARASGAWPISFHLRVMRASGSTPPSAISFGHSVRGLQSTSDGHQTVIGWSSDSQSVVSTVVGFTKQPGPRPPSERRICQPSNLKAPQCSPSQMLPQVLGTRWYPGFDSKAEEERKIQNMLNSVAGKYVFTAVGGTSVSREAFSRRARTTRMAPLDETLSFLAQNGSKTANHGRPS